MSIVAGRGTHAVVERAAALVPMLRKNAPETERSRRVPQENYDAMAEAGIFTMAAPARYGGSEADVQTQCDALAQIARGCASSSWVATIYSAMGWLVATFPDQAQDELLGPGDPRISGVFSPTGTAVRKDGGVIVNGSWPFNTGCHGARWTVLNALLDGMPTCVIARSSDLHIRDDWYASGMAGTGSNTIVADNVFVPAHRVQSLVEMLEARYADRHNASNPYFNYPLAPVLSVNAGGTPVGIAHAALEEFMERLPGRAITYTNYTNKAEAPITHLQVGEAAMKIDSADAHIGISCAMLDRHGSGPMTMPQRVAARAHIAYATGLAREAVDLIFHSSGASSIQAHLPIQRIQRDMQALANHAIMHGPTALELHGRVLCGLQPNTPLY